MRMGHRLSAEIDLHFADATRPVLALGGAYPASHHVRLHRHRRSQLFCPLSGVALATTSQGAWAVPAMRGFWIPAGVRHELRMQGVVEMRSLYFEPRVLGNMPNSCQVLEVSPLMHSLMAEAVALPVRYALDGRSGALMQLIQYEIQTLPELPLSLALPTDKALLRLCRRFLVRPTASDNIDDWAQALHMSRRTFTRFFRRETNLSFVEWRQQACILTALPKLAAGASVTHTALELGYENPAAFTALFKRILGASPRDYTQQQLAGEKSVVNEGKKYQRMAAREKA
ncbi:AraC family transcriptional regulator [Silvibacterium sp.]|uniref:AraC family transcriptional regulator n=1 Tax=Silvibacterium sp. TaxID=1964179 RepID=UPI0039E5DADE